MLQEAGGGGGATAAGGGGGGNCCRWRWRNNERSTGEVIVTSPTKRILEAARKRYNESLNELTEVKARTCLTDSQFYVHKVEVSK